MIPASLVLNAGSSSLKFQVFEPGEVVEPRGDGAPRRLYRGLFEGLGGAAHMIVRDQAGAVVADERFAATGFGHEEALLHVAAWLRDHRSGHRLAAVGHRVVHGGADHTAPVRIDDAVLAALERLVPLAPLHQPHNLAPIRILRRRFPDLPQVACFDTAFHRGQPEIAQLFALPAEITDRGVRRYGFHGLSYAFVAGRLGAHAPALAAGRVVAAHLGSGASLCALAGGRSIATTMGFSALDGLPMGTRCGSLDPGVVFYLMREMRLGADEAERLLYTRSGLLGVSGLSNDMRVLRARRRGPARGRPSTSSSTASGASSARSSRRSAGSTASSSLAASARKTSRLGPRCCGALPGPASGSTRPRMRRAARGSPPAPVLRPTSSPPTRKP